MVIIMCHFGIALKAPAQWKWGISAYLTQAYLSTGWQNRQTKTMHESYTERRGLCGVCAHLVTWFSFWIRKKFNLIKHACIQVSNLMLLSCVYELKTSTLYSKHYFSIHQLCQIDIWKIYQVKLVQMRICEVV